MYHIIKDIREYLNKKGVSHQTVCAYVRDIHAFLAYVSTYHIYAPHDLKQHHVNAYIDYLRRCHVTRSTAKRRCTAIEMFLERCSLNCHVSRPKTNLHIFCYPQDIDHIYHNLQSTNDPYAYRDLTMIMLQHICNVTYKRLIYMRLQDITHAIGTQKIYHNTIPDQLYTLLHTYVYAYAPHLFVIQYDHIAFPYISQNTPHVMPYRSFVARMKMHLSHVQKDTLHAWMTHTSPSDYDSTLKKRYQVYHDRA